MAKTQKIMEITISRTRYLVIKDITSKYNPYKVYRKWWDHGDHRQKVTEYADIESVLWFLQKACHMPDGLLAFDREGCIKVN